MFVFCQVVLVVKNPSANAGDLSNAGLIPGWEDPLKDGVAIHPSILAWRISWTEEPGRGVHGVAKSHAKSQT